MEVPCVLIFAMQEKLIQFLKSQLGTVKNLFVKHTWQTEERQKLKRMKEYEADG